MNGKQVCTAIEMELAEPSSPDELAAYFRFRWQFLRAPWGQPLDSEKDEFEESAHHLLARIPSGELVGVGRIHFPAADTAQIRFMATKKQFRHLGIGSAIVKRLERFAEARGVQVVTLTAREVAVTFYEGLGYSVCGDAHTLFGVIKHKKMEKLL